MPAEFLTESQSRRYGRFQATPPPSSQWGFALAPMTRPGLCDVEGIGPGSAIWGEPVSSAGGVASVEDPVPPLPLGSASLKG